MPPVVEISVDSVESALTAEGGGAQRVELCSALREGGLTPSLGLIRNVRAALALPLFVIIRPRSGDFLYTEAEFRVMREDIRLVQEAGVDGVVLGLLKANGDVDEERTRELVRLARPLQVTFHRAFDMVRSPQTALEAVIRSDCNRILTSGGYPTAIAGADTLRTLARIAEGRITLVAGGGVRPGNVSALLRTTGLREVHSSMRRSGPSAMEYRPPQLAQVSEAGFDEFTRSFVLPEDVRELVQAARAATSAGGARTP